MTPRAGLNAEARAEMIRRLSIAGQSVAAGESTLFHAKLERDREIKKATEIGLSRREVAEAVGLTAAGIQQILSRT